MAPLAYNPKTNSVTAVDYAVPATGDTWFQPTIASSDSPDYTAAKTEAVTQCGVMSPLGQESVVS